MAVKRKALGRGLGDLLQAPAVAVTATAEAEPAAQQATALEGLKMLPLDVIQSGKYQPRKDIDVGALEELASSIRTQGVLQPIVVRPISKDRYEIIAGERRWRAAQLANLEQIPTMIREVSDETTMALALIENIQRENLNPMEEAAALQRLMDEFNMTHQQIAESVGKPRSSVTNLLRLNGLNADVKTLVEHGDLELGHAKVLLTLEGTAQSQAARMVVAKGLSVRETESLAKRLQSPAKQLYKQKVIDPDVLNLQQRLAEKVGAMVQIQHNAKGKGKLVIHYHSLDELDGILEHIN